MTGHVATAYCASCRRVTETQREPLTRGGRRITRCLTCGRTWPIGNAKP